jgi:hypothetical protein
MAGVTLTVGKEEKGVTVSVASDVSASRPSSRRSLTRRTRR